MIKNNIDSGSFFCRKACRRIARTNKNLWKVSRRSAGSFPRSGNLLAKLQGHFPNSGNLLAELQEVFHTLESLSQDCRAFSRSWENHLHNCRRPMITDNYIYFDNYSIIQFRIYCKINILLFPQYGYSEL